LRDVEADHMENNKSVDSANKTGFTPQICDLRFPAEDDKDRYAIEFVLNNPSSNPILIHQASIGYYDRDPTLSFINTWEPDTIYKLAILVSSITSPGDIELMNGISKESLDEREWTVSVSDSFILGSGELSIKYSFPLSLEVDTKKQTMVRLIATEFQLLPGANAEESKIPSLIKEMDTLAARYGLGYTTIALEGNLEEPIKTQLADHRLLQFVARISKKVWRKASLSKDMAGVVCGSRQKCGT
jgi:hypothetical protein